MTTATPAKLADGSWGARVPEGTQVGAHITVKTTAGKTWTARVVELVGPTLARTSSISAKVWRGSRGSSSALSLADRGLIRVAGPRGSYVREMTRDEEYDER